jgi:hypothetical protein
MYLVKLEDRVVRLDFAEGVNPAQEIAKLYGDAIYVQVEALPDKVEYLDIVDGEVVISSSKKGAEINAYKETYMEQRALYYPYKTTVIKMTDGARADLSTLYFIALTDLAIPNDAIMASWREDGYSPLPITAGDLRADGKKFMEHRQKCFTALTLLNGTQYNTKQEVETAFDNFYNSL